MNNKFSTRMLVEAGVMIALAYVLSLVKVWQAPFGGSVTAGSMVPILLFAFRWGAKPGILVGMVYGLLQFILGPKWSFHVISILFDYVVAFGFLGVAGFFKGSNIKSVVGVFVAIFLRFAGHVVSGVVVFGMYAPEGTSPIIYSVIYNAQYLVPEFVICGVIFALLYSKLTNANILTQ